MDRLEELRDYISMTTIPKSWNLCYKSCLDTFNKDWISNFDFKEICKFYNLPEDFIHSLLETISLLKSDINLNFICYLFYYILYISDEAHDIWSWNCKGAFAKHGNYMINAISLLAGYSIHIKNMKNRNYDDYQIDMHKQNLYRNIMNDYIAIKGLKFRLMVWLSTFIKCNIIEVGRLQYNYHSTVDIPYLCNSKHHIELHIPGGKSLDIQSVQQSLLDAPKYIYSYFGLDTSKELEFYVQSWLFSPELKYFLNEGSNILNFQKLFDTVEYTENLEDFMLFVFNISDIPKDFSVLSDKSSLQKNMKSYLLNGNTLHTGTAILKNEYINY